MHTLACDGKAPRIFAKLSRGGVPRNALYATTVIAGLCFLTSMFGNQTVYLWLLNTSGMTGFIAWLGIAISHYRFRRGYVLQGHDMDQFPLMLQVSSHWGRSSHHSVSDYHFGPELRSVP
ncbi:hypothetical protein ACLB1E_17640 [Escherichia coli]